MDKSAITQNADHFAAVDGQQCIGCGLCSAHCPEKAGILMPRQPANHPPDIGKFLERKLG